MDKKTIFIGSDHRGYSIKEHLKKFLKEKDYDVKDLGCNSNDPCDYPDYAKKVAKEVLKTKDSVGILVCMAGIGMSIAANKFKGIYAALISTEFQAAMAKTHNNANIITLGSTIIDEERAELMVNAFLNSEFEGGRHEKRLNKIKEIENDN